MSHRRTRNSRAPRPSASTVQSSNLQDAEEVYSILDTSYTTHSVSPLFLGNEDLGQERLQRLSQVLRDTLVGDVVRGVQVGLESDDGALGRAGPLEIVRMRWMGVNTLLGASDESSRRSVSLDLSTDAPFDQTDGAEKARAPPGARNQGLWINIQYENASCTAVLLPPIWTDDTQQDLDHNGEPDSNSSHFLHLPLLLLRMPGALKPIMIDFLSSTFDCRVRTLRLGTRSLMHSWEAWVENEGFATRGPAAKDLALTLSFYIPPSRDYGHEKEVTGDADEAGAQQLPRTAGLRSLDIMIPPEDLAKFARAGESLINSTAQPQPPQPWQTDALLRHKMSGGSVEEGWAWHSAPTIESTRGALFTHALARYLGTHLALDLFHPCVRVTKIACGGFVLSETRLKVFSRGADGVGVAPSVRQLFKDLTTRATGEELPSIF